MDKIEKLKLMDKILRELEDLQSSQTAVLKKVSQIEAHNISLGLQSLQDKLPNLHEQIDSSVVIVSDLVEAFSTERDTFFIQNKMGAILDPTL
ncbi:MAG: hypothetical protein EOP48_32730 [Sphingobacteriales bacterium]|nr:MAG: hypothetical protein EOP48_32730 [Sphingobacteriales bacterium]